MADKTIGELPAIQTLSDAAMLPVEQNGAAGRISGAQWKQYATDPVSSYVDTATAAADVMAVESASDTSGCKTQEKYIPSSFGE